jgi:hypothetical protein
MIEHPSIRPITEIDIQGVIALWTECRLIESWNDPRVDIERARASAEATILVADDGQGRIIGSVMAGNDGHRGWLYYVAGAPEFQGTGLGRRMVMAAEDWLKARGVVKLMLMIRPSNTAVHGFYEALGYEEQDRVLMCRWLDGRPMTP